MRKYNAPPAPASLWQKPAHFIAFGFGSGAVPFMPGTTGTLMAIPFYLLLAPLSLKTYLMAVAVICILSAWLCGSVSKEIGVEDHQGMCLDEFAGFFVAMAGVPAKFVWIIAGFTLFRLFDIWKPWPIRWVDEKIHGGTGMILDDVLAGVYSAVILHIVMRITGS